MRIYNCSNSILLGYLIYQFIITIAVFGSRPEFGSSQNKYFGFITTALAIATLFCIPPDNSEGSLFNESDKLTLS